MGADLPTIGASKDYLDFIHYLSQQHASLAIELAGFHTLENVLNWMRRRGLHLGSIDVVAHDEYSHDLLIPMGVGERHVIFGVT
jgi:hypothetical protein